MKNWVVQYRRVGSEEWHTATRTQVLYWIEEIARAIADQSNKVDREGFEWRAVEASTAF
jgi:hypothetical protein